MNVKVEHGEIVLSFNFDPNIVAKVKAIHGSKWNSLFRVWTIPYSTKNIQVLKKVGFDITGLEDNYLEWDSQEKDRFKKYMSEYTGPDYDGEDIWRYLEIIDIVKRPESVGITVLNIGLGTGYPTYELDQEGMIVYGLDKSQIALDNISDFLKDSWTNSKYLPSNFFDLAISHLVVQYMNDEHLLYQLRNIIQSLKFDGILAIQFASPYDPNIKETEILTYHKEGTIERSVERMEQLIRKASGQVVYRCKTVNYPKDIVGGGYSWNGFHVKRLII
jgi:SAM-dependent methyltransferase